MQQLMQVLQQQEGFAKLTAVQQQQLCMQLFLKQQQHHLMQQQQAAVAAAGGNPGAALPQQANAAAQPQNLSPRSGSVEPQVPVGGGQPVTMAGPNPTGHPAFQRSTSQPGETPANWSSETSPATSGDNSRHFLPFPHYNHLVASNCNLPVRLIHLFFNIPPGNWTPQPTSVWDIGDIDPPKSQAQSSFEDIQRMEMERQRRVCDLFFPFFQQPLCCLLLFFVVCTCCN